MKTTH